MTAGPRHTRHFTSAAGDDGADLDDVVVGQERVAGYELVAADHEHRLTVDVEALQQRDDGRGPSHLHLAGGVAELHDHAPKACLVIPVSRTSTVSPGFSTIRSTTSTSRVTRFLRNRATPMPAHTAN